MTMDVKSEAQPGGAGGAGPQKCAGCGKPITDRFMLKALDMLWHEDCLKCSCCDCRLGEVGSTFYTKANLILCKRDYLRLFGNTGYCAACSKVIPAFEMVMRARHNVYHLECFACQQCSHRFCVGDRFYLCENKILCEYDYEERMVFANMAYNPPPISHLKRQTNIHPPPPPHMQGIGGQMSQPCSSDMGSPDRRGAASMQQVPQQQQQQQQQSQQAVNVAVSSSGSTGSNGFHDGLGLGQGLGQGMSQGLSQGMGQGLSQGLGVGPGLGSK